MNLPNDLMKSENKVIVKESLKESFRQLNGNPPLVDPIKDMKIEDENLEKLDAKKRKVEEVKLELEKKLYSKCFTS